MQAWIGKIISKCINKYADSHELGRSMPRLSRTLQERLEGNMPSLIAFKIENGFLVDTQSGMRYCKDASEIAEAVVLAETKQKMGLTKGSSLRESSQVMASNGGF